jgi:hypothetical protein
MNHYTIKPLASTHYHADMVASGLQPATHNNLSYYSKTVKKSDNLPDLPFQDIIASVQIPSSVDGIRMSYPRLMRISCSWAFHALIRSVSQACV